MQYRYLHGGGFQVGKEPRKDAEIQVKQRSRITCKDRIVEMKGTR